MRSSIMLSDLFLVDTPKKLIFDFLFSFMVELKALDECIN